MNQYDDIFDVFSTETSSIYASFGQTYYDYYGCFPEDDDIIDHVKAPLVIAVYR